MVSPFLGRDAAPNNIDVECTKVTRIIPVHNQPRGGRLNLS